MRFRKSAHAVYQTEYHIVWTPRYRRKLFQEEGVMEYAEKVLAKLEDLEDDIEVKKVNVQEDHVHMVVIIPPRRAVAKVVQFIKSQSGKKLKTKYEFMRRAIWGRGGIWSRGYCVSSVGMSEAAIMNYVTHQDKDDRGQLELDF